MYGPEDQRPLRVLKKLQTSYRIDHGPFDPFAYKW